MDKKNFMLEIVKSTDESQQKVSNTFFTIFTKFFDNKIAFSWMKTLQL